MWELAKAPWKSCKLEGLPELHTQGWWMVGCRHRNCQISGNKRVRKTIKWDFKPETQVLELGLGSTVHPFPWPTRNIMWKKPSLCPTAQSSSGGDPKSTTDTLKPWQIPLELPIYTELGKGEKHKLQLTFPPLKSRKKLQEATHFVFPGVVLREELLPCLVTS